MAGRPGLLAWIVPLALVTAASGCCRCRTTPPQEPQVRAEYVECRHPALAEVDRCLAECPAAGAEGAGACRRGCCGMVQEVADATGAEKAALLRCREGCR